MNSPDALRPSPDPVPQGSERRARRDRRRRRWWAFIYGNFNPRRRGPKRREGDASFHWPDWHAPHLLAVSIGILLLSVADAFMTVTLLDAGAIEVNPVMALVIQKGAAWFAALKMLMTGAGVMFLVVLARQRVLRVFRVDVVMYVLLLGYMVLLGYEFQLLRNVPQALAR